MQTELQIVRDEVISTLTKGGKAAADDYIKSLTDPDQRDAARVQLATFLAIAEDFPTALGIAKQVEDDIERIDALLALSRLLDAHHHLQEKRHLLEQITALAEGRPEEADFQFLVAMEYEHLQLRRTAITSLRRAIELSSANGDNKLLANAALWLARWGIENEPEEIIRRFGDDVSHERTLRLLENIREFQRTSGTGIN